MAILMTWSKFVRLGRSADAPIVNADHVEYIETKQRERSNCFDMSFHMRSGAVVDVCANGEDMLLIIDSIGKAGSTEGR